MHARTNADLSKQLDMLLSEWNKHADSKALLKQLNTSILDGDKTNLLHLAARQRDTQHNRKILYISLALAKKLAQHEKTDIKELISLLTATTDTTIMQVSGLICTNYRHNIDSLNSYFSLFEMIAAREDVTADDLRKLVSHHDQRGQQRGKEFDGSIVFDLIKLEAEELGDKHLLETYLATLVKLAEAKKIDSDSIYSALRTPLGIKKNIGTLIADTYFTPECFLHFTRLCDFLVPTQIDQLFPGNYGYFRSYSLKERVCQYIEKLPTPESQIAVCERARDKDSALGRFMHLQRNPSGQECDESRGANKRLKALYGNALVARDEQYKQLTKTRAKAPRPSAPPLSESEYVELFSKQPPKEYLAEVRDEVFQLQEPDEIGTALRFAAGYNNNEKLKRLLSLEKVDVNYCHDIGDTCKDATALYLAAEQNNIEGVKFLLQKGANPNIARQIGTTPLCCAAINGNAEIAKLLLDHDANINVKTRFKNTPLYFAASQGQHEVLEVLVEYYCHEYANNVNDLVTFLQQDSHLLLCIKDIRNGASVLALDKLINFLHEKGVEKDVINAMIPQEYTFKHHQLKESLKDAIADIRGNQRRDVCDIGMNNTDSLLYKVLWMNRGGMKCRLEAGVLAEVKKIRDAYGNPDTKFQQALCKYTQTNIAAKDLTDFEQALKDGADADGQIKGFQALMCAAARGDTKLVKLLIQHGADHNLSHQHSHNGIRKTIKWRGCDKARSEQFIQENNDKEIISLTAESYARLCMFDETADVLRKHREALEEKAAAVTEIDSNIAFAPPVAAPTEEIAPPSYAEETAALAALATLPVTVEPAHVIERIYPVLPSMTDDEHVKTPRLFESYLHPQKIAVTVEEVKIEVKPEPERAYVNPFNDVEMPVAEQDSADPFVNIDQLLSAEKAPTQPSWMIVLAEIDFSPVKSSSTALVLETLGDLISFDEPVKAKPYQNPFAELVEQPAPEIKSVKRQYVNPFIDSLSEQKRDAGIAEQLDALPSAPKGTLFETKQKENKSKSNQKPRVMVPN